MGPCLAAQGSLGDSQEAAHSNGHPALCDPLPALIARLGECSRGWVGLGKRGFGW